MTTTLSSCGRFGLPFFTFPHPKKGSFAQVKVVGTLTKLNFIPRYSEVRLLSFSLYLPTLVLLGPKE